MSNPVSTTMSSHQPRWRADVIAPVAALGVAAAITGYATAWLRHRQQQRHTVITRAVVSDNRHSADIAADRDKSQPVLPGISPLATGTGEYQEGTSVVRAVDLKRAVARRPGLAVAVIAAVAAIVIWAVAVLVTAHGPNDSTPAAPSAKPADPMPAEADPMMKRSMLIPISEGDAIAGSCTADGVCTDKVFTMKLGGGGPWVVTRVGYRPLEILPGRRVTRLRWELRDTDMRSDLGTVVFTQSGEVPDPDGLVTYDEPLRGGAYRAMRITAVVEASIPAPGAVRTGLGPFEVYGYPGSSSDEAEFPTKAPVDAVTWSVDPFTVSRIAIVPGPQAAESDTDTGNSRPRM